MSHPDPALTPGVNEQVAHRPQPRRNHPARTSSYMSLAIHSPDPLATVAAARGVVHAVDAELPVAVLQTARAALADTIEKPRFLATVMIALSATAMVLAVLGVYGVLSYAVTRRRRELGVRLAIGASILSVTTIFMRRGLLLTVAGLAAGGVLGRVLARLSQSLLFGVRPGDPTTTVAVATLMIATATIGCLVPARRATRVDPLEVLRAE